MAKRWNIEGTEILLQHEDDDVEEGTEAQRNNGTQQKAQVEDSIAVPVGIAVQQVLLQQIGDLCSAEEGSENGSKDETTGDEYHREKGEGRSSEGYPPAPGIIHLREKLQDMPNHECHGLTEQQPHDDVEDESRYVSYGYVNHQFTPSK